MKHCNFRHMILGLAIMTGLTAVASPDEETTRRQRNYVHQGTELYRQKRYSEAEVAFNKALEINPASEIVNYNYAMSLLHQAQPSDQPDENNPLGIALQRLNQLMEAENATVAELAAYNLGNQSFGKENYKEAIEYYKRSLMKNPDNDQARENLRLAQIKQKEQEQNQDNNDQNQNQDQQQNQDRQQQDQQQQDQNQNQDQQNQDQQQQDRQQPDRQEQQPQQPQQQGISPENAQKILNTVEKAEAATRAKVDEKKKEEERRAVGRPRGNQW